MVEDILYTRAKAWFQANGHTTVVRVEECESTIIGRVGTCMCYTGWDEDGKMVAMVTLDQLSIDDKVLVDGCKGFIEKSIWLDAIRQATLGSPMLLYSQIPQMPPIQPLLVISYRAAFTKTQYYELSKHIEHLSNLTGWRVCVVDGMDEAKVQAFGVSLPTLDTLSLDSIIELLEGLKRVREAASDPIPGSDV